MPHSLARTRKLLLKFYKHRFIDIFKFIKLIHENIQYLGLFPLTDMQTPPLKSVPSQKVIMNGAECSE